MDAFLLTCFLSAFFALAGLLFLGLIAYAVLSRGAQETAWRVLASRTGLVYQKGGFLKRASLGGVLRGRRASIDIHSHSGGYQPGSGSFPYTRLRLALENAAGLKLEVHEKSRLPSFLRATTPSGDPAVDERYSIISQPPELAVRLFERARLRDGILAARSFDLEIDGPQLCFEARGVEKDIDYLVGLLDLLSEVAGFVEEHNANRPPAGDYRL